MATAIEKVQPVKCGFCCRIDGALDEPKILPCRHVHCFGCLSASFEVNHIIQCPVPGCGQVFDIPLTNLPSHETSDGDSLLCDVCAKKGKSHQEADIYCIQCERKLCTNHQESHDDLFENHKTIGIESYKSESGRLHTRKCEEHKDQPYNAACKKCLKVICVGCLSELGNCIDGGNHELLSLDDLVKVLKKEINDLKEKMREREEQLGELFKLTSKKVSEYDDVTRDMVDLIHQTRDEQLQCLREKYRKLEEELIQARLTVRAEMVEFLEGNVGAKWSGLRNHRLKIEARHKQSHQCDIVSGYQVTKDEIQRLIDDLLPTLNIPKCTSLCTRDKSRDIELGMLSVEGVQIDGSVRETALISPPKSLTSLNSVKFSRSVTSVFVYEGNTYVGSYGGSVTKIIGRSDQSRLFHVDNNIGGLAVYKDKVYSLMYGRPSVLHVHDLSGKLLLKWHHTHYNEAYLGIVVCSDKLLVPDRAKQQLVLYNLTGDVVETISCALSDDRVFLCAAGDNSVVVCDYDLSKVFKVNISSREVMWECTGVAKPQGVTCYRNRYVLVASAASSQLNMLDVHTGKVVSQIGHQNISGPDRQIFDMHISGNTLVVSDFDRKHVHFFQLKQ